MVLVATTKITAGTVAIRTTTVTIAKKAASASSFAERTSLKVGEVEEARSEADSETSGEERMRKEIWIAN